MKDKLLKNILHYGLRCELKKLNEEVYELQESIFDYETFLNQIPNRILIAKEIEKDLKTFDKIEEESIELRKHLIEEYSDVCLILEQIKVFFELENDSIIKMMEQKLDRQMTRIAKEKE